MSEPACYDCERLPTARQREICRGEAMLLPSVRRKYLDRWLAAGLISETECPEPSSASAPEPPIARQAPVARKTGRRGGRGDPLACSYRGAKTGVLDTPGCNSPPQVYACSLRGRCVLIRDGGRRQAAIEASGLPICRECNDREKAPIQITQTRCAPRPTPVTRARTSPFAARAGTPEFVTTGRLMLDVRELASKLPADVSRVVGVARSGLCAASLVAMLRHLPLSVVRQSTGDVTDGGNGWRLRGAATGDGPVALIDDTCMTGGSLRRVLPVVQRAFGRVVSAAVYVNPNAHLKPDLWARELPWPHLLEWNLFNSVLSPHVALDFDGILCEDCPPADDDDGDRYARFLETARPLYLARKTPVPLIVTARLEKYRAPTLAWLDRHGVRVRRLVMGPWGTKAERSRADTAAFKAEHYRAFAAGRHRIQPPLFVESDARQAARIAEMSGALVACPAAGRCFGPTDAGTQTPARRQRRVARAVRPTIRKATAAVPATRTPTPWPRHVLRWAVGITTAQREQPTLERTLASLAAAGWTRPLVAAEPGVVRPDGVEWLPSKSQLGGWRNFLRLASALAALPCDVALLLQDDVVLTRGLRTYLERSVGDWPAAAAMSLYSSSRYDEGQVQDKTAWGWRSYEFRNMEGILALVMRRETLAVLGDWRTASRNGKYADARFGRWANRRGGVAFHYPSLAQHIGDTSVQHPGAGNVGSRQSASFVGEDFDLLGAHT